MLLRVAFLAVLVLATSCECAGQTPIQGHVVDDQGLALSNVLVRDCTSPRQACIETRTDGSGRFELSANIDPSCKATEEIELVLEGCEPRVLSFPLDGESGTDDVGVVVLSWTH